MKHLHRQPAWLTLVGAAGLASASQAQVASPTVIFTEIATSPTSTVPGALDSAGSPVATNFIALEDFAVRHDGGDWILKARTAQASTNDSILIRGGSGSPTMFAQDGQPILGGAAGELYDFFDSPFPAAWDSNGNMAFGARAKGGVASVFEKIIRVNGSTHTIVVQMGDAVTGLVDVPANITGDELLGNSMNSIHLLDSGEVGFTVTPITNCHSSRYPALIRGHAGFKQSGVSTIGSEIWDSFVGTGHYATPDAAHWYAEGDTEGATTADAILVVDDAIVFQEGSPVVSGGPTCAAIFATRMAPNGDWISRGDDPADDDWAVYNGALIAKTGDPVTMTENWGVSFLAAHCNATGRWILAGETDNVDTTANQVLVLDDGTVLLREGQSLDIDGNGMFDDDAFLATIQANDVYITDNGVVFALITIRNGAGTSQGDGLLTFSISTVTSYCTAGTTSNGCLPAISGTGTPSATAGSGFTIDAINVEGQRAGLLFYGINGPNAAMWAAGSTSFLCVKSPLRRMGSQSTGGTNNACNGALTEDWNLYIATHPGALGQPFGGGETVWAQGWFRDPPAVKTTNLTDGLQFVVQP